MPDAPIPGEIVIVITISDEGSSAPSRSGSSMIVTAEVSAEISMRATTRLLRQAQPSSFRAIPAFHIFVRWLILSPLNCMT
jgi:hypothetical protein